jgi:hypothetical protein
MCVLHNAYISVKKIALLLCCEILGIWETFSSKKIEKKTSMGWTISDKPGSDTIGQAWDGHYWTILGRTILDKHGADNIEKALVGRYWTIIGRTILGRPGSDNIGQAWVGQYWAGLGRTILDRCGSDTMWQAWVRHYWTSMGGQYRTRMSQTLLEKKPNCPSHACFFFSQFFDENVFPNNITGRSTKTMKSFSRK